MRFRHWRIYGERGLAGEAAAIWLYGEHLTVQFADEPLSQYEVRYAADQKELQGLSNPQLFTTQFRSPQLLLWELGPDDWHLVMRQPESTARRSTPHSTAIQLSRLPETGESLAKA